MDELEITIRNKVLKYSIGAYDDLDEKEKNRILQVEKYIQKCNRVRALCLKIYKKNKISKNGFSKSRFATFVRKTIYNNDIIDRYICEGVKEQEDIDITITYSKSTETLEKENVILKNQYDKMIKNIINIKKLESAIQKSKEEIKELKEKLSFHELEIGEKDSEIKRLLSIINQNEITNITKLR